MKNLDAIRAQLEALKQTGSAQAKALAKQLEDALAGAKGKAETSALLSSVRAALTATSASFDRSTPEGQQAADALERAEVATRSMPRDATTLAGVTRALHEATAAAKKAREGTSRAPKGSFKILPGTRR